MGTIAEQAAQLQREWETDPRWAGITRDYTAHDVIRLRGCVAGEHGLARRGASRLWDLLHRRDARPALGVVVGDDAVQAQQAGLPAIYLPGGQAAEGTQAGGGHLGPSLPPVNPMPHLVRRMNNALLRATQPAAAEGSGDGIAPERRLAAVVADAEVGFGGRLDAFELMTAMIEAGAAGVRFEDRLSPGTARGHRSGEVLVPTGQHIQTLTAARLAADVLAVPSLVIARSAARTASLLTSDADDRDHEFLTGERTPDGFHRVEPGLYAHVTRALAFAPYADLLWLETPAPDLAVARAFADIIRSQFPDKLLAYSWPRPSDWRAHPADASVATFQRELAAMGYHFQSAIPGARTAPAESASEPAGRHPHETAPAYA
jgi:isocitrate lyase